MRTTTCIVGYINRRAGERDERVPIALARDKQQAEEMVKKIRQKLGMKDVPGGDGDHCKSGIFSYYEQIEFFEVLPPWFMDGHLRDPSRFVEEQESGERD